MHYAKWKDQEISFFSNKIYYTINTYAYILKYLLKN